MIRLPGKANRGRSAQRSAIDRIPTFEEYFDAHDRLRRLVRRAVNKEGVTRGELRKALEAAERVDTGADPEQLTF